MWKTDLRIELDREERQELERLVRSQVAPHRAVVRAQAILLLAAGTPVSAVARQVGRGRRIGPQVASAIPEKANRGTAGHLSRNGWNESAHSFAWTAKSFDKVLAKVDVELALAA